MLGGAVETSANRQVDDLEGSKGEDVANWNRRARVE
jgi:hypothetical protein